MIPNDPRKPFDPSGFRLGTPALTTRGMAEEHMYLIADWIYKAIINHEDDTKLNKLAREVEAFCKQFPLPSDLDFLPDTNKAKRTSPKQ